MEIVEIDTNKLPKEFFEVAYSVYKSYKPNYYIPPVEQDIAQVLNRTTNKYLENAHLRAAMLYDKSKPVGRIVAWKQFDNPIGEIGFFECLLNETAATLLIHWATDFLKSIQASEIRGFISPGSRDKYWGVLLEEKQFNSFQENYNPTYYNEFLINNGFQVEFGQLTYSITVKSFNEPRIRALADRVMRSGKITLDCVHFDNKAKYIQDFVEIYNQAWSQFDFFKPITIAEIEKQFKELKQIAIPEIMIFAYYEGQPAGFYINIPDLNYIFKKIGPNFNLINKLKFLFYLKTHRPKNLKGIIFGVIPEHHNKGIESALIYEAYKAFSTITTYIDIIELNWIGTFNPKMNSVLEGIGAVPYKKHQVYIKSL